MKLFVLEDSSQMFLLGVIRASLKDIVTVLPLGHKSDLCQNAIDIPLQT